MARRFLHTSGYQSTRAVCEAAELQLATCVQ